MNMDERRRAREAELIALTETGNGRFQLVRMYMAARGASEGTAPPVGTMLRTEMIPAILEHEFASVPAARNTREPSALPSGAF